MDISSGFRPDKKTLSACRIFRMLQAHARGRHLSFHTPGHKVNGWDITELSYSDNLACPQGVILQAERDAAHILGSAASFFLTDGSTSGVLSMLYALAKSGASSLAFPENAHRSVYNGCKLLGLRPVLIPVPRLRSVTLQPAETAVAAGLKEADALLLTSPDYYGNLANWKSARALCDAAKKPLLADGAHGGHLHFDKRLHAGGYADLWVDGVHKSLPAFTQGAVVSARNARFASLLKEGVDIFRTSSPSYPILASVEYALKFPRRERTEREVLRFAAEHPGRIHEGGDWTKLYVFFGSRAFEAEKQLEKEGIYPEFCDGDGILFYLSPATRLRDFRILKKTLFRFFSSSDWQDDGGSRTVGQTPLRGEKEGEEIEYLPLSEAAGRRAARTCGLFPPCIPLVFAGEILTAEKAALLRDAANVFGLGEGRTFPAERG